MRKIVKLRGMNNGFIAYVAAGQIAAIEADDTEDISVKVTLANGLSFGGVFSPALPELLDLMSDTTTKPLTKKETE
jgi:hypothetical protein